MPEPATATERAYEVIRRAILDGLHPAGTMLSESALAEEVGVSRTPVRAALVRLQDEGWITIYPKRGALVQGLDEKAITDLVESRLILEATAVQRADVTARRALADRLAGGLDEQHRTLADGRFRDFVELTVAFHRAFVEVGGNDVLLELYDRLADRQRFLLFHWSDTMLARREAVVDEHRLLLDALRADDVAAFAEQLRVHICEVLGSPLRPLALR